MIQDVETYLTLHSWAITLESIRVSRIFSQISLKPQKGVSIIFKGLSIISKRLSIISDLGARIWKWTIYSCDYLIAHTVRAYVHDAHVLVFYNFIQSLRAFRLAQLGGLAAWRLGGLEARWLELLCFRSLEGRRKLKAKMMLQTLREAC